MRDKIKKILKSNGEIYNLLLEAYDSYNSIKIIYNDKRAIINKIRMTKSKKKDKNIYFLLDQGHGNLGDQAIAYAEQLFVKDNFGDYNVNCIMEKEYKLFKKYFQRAIKRDDVIALIGGGSIGNQYIEHERSRRDIIETFSNNKIISFPQTIFFSKDKYGESELENSINIYSKHRDLTIIAREDISYRQMKKVFNNNNVILAPDIVLYLNKTEPRERRRGALCCFRSDMESILSEADKSEIIKIVKKYFNLVSVTDTHLNRCIDIENRGHELEKKFNQFKRAEIVITDRLHGMIFAAITATPCIVLSNYNHKIAGSYAWIKHLGYIKLAERIENLSLYIPELKQLKDSVYNNDFALPYYKNIIDVILSKA